MTSTNVLDVLEAGGLEPEAVRLTVLDEQGQPRAWLSVDDTGPKLVVDFLGTAVITIGVQDAVDDFEPWGPYTHS